MEAALFFWLAGGYLGQQVIQSETASKVINIINHRLDEQLRKLAK